MLMVVYMFFMYYYGNVLVDTLVSKPHTVFQMLNTILHEIAKAMEVLKRESVST